MDIENCAIMEETINEKIRLLRESKRLPTDNELTIWSDCPAGKVDEKKSIIRIVEGKNFLAPRDGFFQANLYLMDKLVEEVCRLIAADKINTLIDAIAEAGFFPFFFLLR